MSKLSALAICSVCLLPACTSFSAGNGDLMEAAKTFARAADECLYDVRDRKLTYEDSLNCRALSVLSKLYIEKGGFANDEPDHHAMVAQTALTTAWMARAVSAAGGRPLRIW